MLTGGGVSTAATAAEAMRAPEIVGWDPYDVWRTRVLLPRLAAASSAAPPPELSIKAPLPTLETAGGAAGVPRKPVALPRMPASVPRAARAVRLPARSALRHVSRALGGTHTAGSWAIFVTLVLALLIDAESSSDTSD